MFKDVIDDDTEKENAKDCREDEKVLHRRSNVNEIVSAGGKNFLPKRSTT